MFELTALIAFLYLFYAAASPTYSFDGGTFVGITAVFAALKICNYLFTGDK